MLPTHCHNCQQPLSQRELDDINAHPRVAEIARRYGQAACGTCCRRAQDCVSHLRADDGECAGDLIL